MPVKHADDVEARQVAAGRERNLFALYAMPLLGLTNGVKQGDTSRRPKATPLDFLFRCVAGSSNGRTADSGSAYWGSNPCPAANK